LLLLEQRNRLFGDRDDLNFEIEQAQRAILNYSAATGEGRGRPAWMDSAPARPPTDRRRVGRARQSVPRTAPVCVRRLPDSRALWAEMGHAIH
jgi:hypothetical protein